MMECAGVPVVQHVLYQGAAEYACCSRPWLASRKSTCSGRRQPSDHGCVAGEVALETLDLKGSSVRGVRVRSPTLKVLTARNCSWLELVTLAGPVELLDLHNCSCLADLTVAYLGPSVALTDDGVAVERHAELSGCPRLPRSAVESIAMWSSSLEHGPFATASNDLFPRV